MRHYTVPLNEFLKYKPYLNMRIFWKKSDTQDHVDVKSSSKIVNEIFEKYEDHEDSK